MRWSWADLEATPEPVVAEAEAWLREIADEREKADAAARAEVERARSRRR